MDTVAAAFIGDGTLRLEIGVEVSRLACARAAGRLRGHATIYTEQSFRPCHRSSDDRSYGQLTDVMVAC